MENYRNFQPKYMNILDFLSLNVIYWYQMMFCNRNWVGTLFRITKINFLLFKKSLRRYFALVSEYGHPSIEFSVPANGSDTLATRFYNVGVGKSRSCRRISRPNHQNSRQSPKSPRNHPICWRSHQKMGPVDQNTLHTHKCVPQRQGKVPILQHCTE